MKNILTLALLLLVIGCTKKKDSAKPTGGASETNYKFIHNIKWDTLYCGANSIHATHANDTIFIFTAGDTSYIKYKGTKLYLFYISNAFIDNGDSAKVHIDCYLSPNVFDTLNSWSICDLESYKYFSSSLYEWQYQNQVMDIHDIYPHFDTLMSGWFYSF